MSPETVLSSLLRQIPGRGDLRVRNRSPVRDFVHVEDVARGLADLALSGLEGTFNIATGIGTSVGDLAAYVAKQAGESDREVVAIAPNPAPSWLVLDPTKMREAMGWKAAIGLLQGVEDLVREKLSARSSFG